MKNKPFATRLGFALAGIGIVTRSERSFRTQLVLAAAALLVTAIAQPGLVWLAIVVLAIGLVLALEMVNAALEYLIDHVHPEHAEPIRHAKDALAGAVLIASLASVVIGALMLLSLAWT